MLRAAKDENEGSRKSRSRLPVFGTVLPWYRRVPLQSWSTWYRAAMNYLHSQHVGVVAAMVHSTWTEAGHNGDLQYIVCEISGTEVTTHA